MKGMIDFLRVIAWIILIGGILGGFIMMIQDKHYGSILENYAIIIGLTIWTTSLINFCILSVICNTASNVVDLGNKNNQVLVPNFKKPDWASLYTITGNKFFITYDEAVNYCQFNNLEIKDIKHLEYQEKYEINNENLNLIDKLASPNELVKLSDEDFKTIYEVDQKDANLIVLGLFIFILIIIIIFTVIIKFNLS